MVIAHAQTMKQLVMTGDVGYLFVFFLNVGYLFVSKALRILNVEDIAFLQK